MQPSAAKRILVVEDETIVARDICRQLEGFGYEVIGNASEGQQAVEMTATHSPDLILMDINLAGAMRGTEAAKIIREQFNIPSIFLTAYFDNASLSEAESASPLNFLVKPFAERDLKTAIRIGLHNEEMDKKLRKSQMRFGSLIQTITDGVIELNFENGESHYSPRWFETLGYQIENFQTTPDLWISFLHPEELQKVSTEWAEFKKNNSLRFAGEFRLRHRLGNYLAFQATGLAFHNDKSKICLIAFNNLTDRKKAFQTMRLEGLVTMSAGVAHDLKNALTPLTMGLEELSKGQPAQPAMLDALEGSVRRGLQIVKQLEGFAKGIKGEHFILKPYYILKDLQPILTATYPKNIVVIPCFDSQLASISGDPGQLQEALLSLCANARDAMPDGGNLRLEAENRQFAAGVITPESPAGAYVVVRVFDNGSGITEENKSRIFDPYFTTKSRQQASGLGLPSAKAIITAHQGFIKFQSVAGQGSCFEVFLPALASEGGEAEPPAEPAADRIAHGSLVLLISQDLQVREMISETLKLLGYAVTSAANETDALVVITEQHQHIGLVLIDQNLPGQDGGSLIRVIRKMLPQANVIALSNRAQDTLKPEFKTQDVTGLWLRPFTQKQFEILGSSK
jgi:signal transduction histidine kinase/DNA-binding NarL/FixJ family response regulator